VSFHFTNDWFDITAKQNFATLLPRFQPKRIVEIGAYEGRATTWMATNLLPQELICIDTWQGGDEHKQEDMSKVMERFMHNCNVVRESHAVHVTRMVGESAKMLLALASVPTRQYDFIYIDGSHRAADVMTDAVLSFQLLRRGGVMAFDDYAWIEKPIEIANPLDNPRLAIDSFYNVFRRQLQVLCCDNAQFWVVKR